MCFQISSLSVHIFWATLRWFSLCDKWNSMQHMITYQWYCCFMQHYLRFMYASADCRSVSQLPFTSNMQLATLDLLCDFNPFWTFHNSVANLRNPLFTAAPVSRMISVLPLSCYWLEWASSRLRVAHWTVESWLPTFVVLELISQIFCLSIYLHFSLNTFASPTSTFICKKRIRCVSRVQAQFSLVFFVHFFRLFLQSILSPFFSRHVKHWNLGPSDWSCGFCRTHQDNDIANHISIYHNVQGDVR